MRPEAIFGDKKIGNEQLTYCEVYENSNEFSSIEDLKFYITKSVISNQEKNNKSIHGLINFIKKYFIDSGDPYITWYVANGVKMDTSYKLLMDIKEIRNSLAHDRGETKSELWTKIDLISKPEDGLLVIDDDIYRKCVLIIKSIAYNIKELIQKEKARK